MVSSAGISTGRDMMPLIASVGFSRPTAAIPAAAMPLFLRKSRLVFIVWKLGWVACRISERLSGAAIQTGDSEGYRRGFLQKNYTEGGGRFDSAEVSIGALPLVNAETAETAERGGCQAYRRRDSQLRHSVFLQKHKRRSLSEYLL